MIYLASVVVGQANAVDFPLLEHSGDNSLQEALLRELKTTGLHRAVSNNSLAISIIDVTNERVPRLAEVNGDMMMYAASLPKIAILLGAMQKVQDGELELTTRLEERLVKMIRHSSNVEASYVLKLVGEEYLANLLQSELYQFYKKDKGGLWVGRSYNQGPVWKRDPLNNISHGATSHEVARFYYWLATDRLVSSDSCSIMREVMSESAIKHKFVAALQNFPDAKVLRKSGTWKTYHSDSAIVERNERRYVVVALANNVNAGKWMEHVALIADKIVFETAKLNGLVSR